MLQTSLNYFSCHFCKCFFFFCSQEEIKILNCKVFVNPYTEPDEEEEKAEEEKKVVNSDDVTLLLTISIP